MDLLGNLKKLLGIQDQPVKPVQAQKQPKAPGIGSLLGETVANNLPLTQIRYYEDGSNSAGGRAMDSPDDFLPEVRSQQQITQAPFRLFEDGTFQGDPRNFKSRNPAYTFYEDNSFREAPGAVKSFETLLNRRR